MAKNKKKKTKFHKKNKNVVNVIIPEYKPHEVQAEEFYKALKRIENEKQAEKSESKALLMVANILFFPFWLHKDIKTNGKIKDGLLIGAISSVLFIFGVLAWGIGISVIYVSYIAEGVKLYNKIINIISGAGILIFGSLVIVSGKEVYQEKDIEKVYNYSSLLIALISCIIALCAFLKGA